MKTEISPSSFRIAFVLIFAIVCLRFHTALGRAEFWAEDGVEFFTAALTRGWHSLWMPVTGYFLFASRALAYLATFFPVVAVPYVYALSCAVLNTATLAYLAREGFAWLIPSAASRVLLACLLSIGPGTSEVFVNLSNLQASLLLLGFLLLLEQPFRLPLWKSGLLTLVFFSAGGAILLGPLLAYHAVTTRRKEYAFALGILALNSYLNSRAHAQFDLSAQYTGLGNWSSLPGIWVNQFAVRLFFLPFLGENGTNFLFRAPDLIFICASIAGLALFLGALRISRLSAKRYLPLWIAFASAVAYFCMVALFRTYNFDFIRRRGGIVLWAFRYSFLSGCLAILIWWVILSALGGRSDRRAKLTAGMAGVWLAFFPIRYFWELPPRPNLHWPRTAALIQSALDEKRAGTLRKPKHVTGITLQPNGYTQIEVVIEP